MNRIVIPEDAGLVGKALKEKRVIITNDPYSDPDFNSDIDKQTGYITLSVLVMPVAGVLAQHCRDYDSVYRWRDDEFVMVMPATDLDECKRIADEIRVDLMNSPFIISVLPVKVTMSFGCCKYDRAKTIEENIAVADENLFCAKDSGRNNVYG